MAFPGSARDLLSIGSDFRCLLAAHKESHPPQDGWRWYPFDSLSSLHVLAELLAPEYPAIRDAMQSGSAAVADIGCADGEVGLLFASLGCDVDMIDCARYNFNRMEGVRSLAARLGVAVHIHDLDLDSGGRLPRDRYRLAVALGTLYHLKNPYGFLEDLAYRAEWCLLNTRIARTLPRTGFDVDSEPVAYLADGREINEDATNYWIFTGAGLLRILQRTRWAVVGTVRVGCAVGSSPIEPGRDERMFVLLKSRVWHPELAVGARAGWHAVESDGESSWRWTAKRFSAQMVLPLETAVSGFSFDFDVAPELLRSQEAVAVSCSVAGEVVGRIRCETPGRHRLEARLEPAAAHLPILMLDFDVASSFACPPDTRELGVCVPLSNSGRLPFTYLSPTLPAL
jgi:hypothetical protein